MKSLAVVLLMLHSWLPGSGQGVFTNHTHTALQQVIGDFRYNFSNIKGKEISQDPQTTDFASRVQIPGAISTVITRYSSDPGREVYSWKCLLQESDDFEEVSRKYRELYDQLKNSIIKIEGEKPFILNGTYHMPTEEKRFISSALHLLPPTGNLRKVKVELTLEFLVTAWKVSVLVYDSSEEELVMD